MTNSSPLWILLSSGVLAQMAAKFVLSEFGRSATYLLDPLAFHSGLGEVADHQSGTPLLPSRLFNLSAPFWAMGENRRCVLGRHYTGDMHMR